ncbi:E3 ubiquitin-protein ligase TRIM39-like [Hypomesus transpacificus]|uniref:E3 ubiquitin-protein ligase TRIM39-like n=1 Tax=Hypomesus transpacificus TaxID=137520 RepID=UPI001F074684|nr:E3 ubiquitin-protein ligase TRIM39-like [Hypomesus transpacificus]
MASCSTFLSEDQFLCSICLDVFTYPVTISCGQNFCKACITKYWDNSDLCQCPMCKMTFDKRPDFYVNTSISEMAAQFRKSEPLKATISPDLRPTKPEVSCDICTGTKLKALKSCLGCLASYCETHLETVHNTHDTVTLEDEYKPKKDDLGKLMAEMNQMMEERSRKVQEIKLSVETSKSDAEKDISDSVQVFTALVRSFERIHAEIIEVMEEKQKAAEKQAERLIKDLEQEITELKRRSTELEQLSHTEDHLHLLQSFPSLSTPLHTKDWSEISVHSGLILAAVRRAVSQLEETLNKEMEKLPEVKLKRIQQYAVDVTLDPDTAHPYLILSEDGKQVRLGGIKLVLPDNPERFDLCNNVLGKQGFSSGRFYYEVLVEGKTNWGLGVVRDSINRKGKITASPKNGYWIVVLKNGNKYIASGRSVLSLRQKPQKVGVFVDYEEGLVSFYDVEARSHIYSFTGCTFTKKLYPLFSPFLNDGGKNSVPLLITPVTR